ncbi:MAG: 2-oxoacid:acceptor oxidoreductase family protein [Planctomycetota bacterium]|jgi:2-oxoglutarate ferredoxin oxidoreductase subunit gamma
MTGTEVVMAGFGGQGMLLAGEILAHAAMEVGLQVSWLPSYGPEMRGGTANATVCISDKPIGSPLITSPRALLVMNQPSLEKFAPTVRPGGVIVVNASMVPVESGRDDCTNIRIRAREMAIEAGNERAANFVMLGAYVGATGAVPDEAVETAIQGKFTGGKARFVPVNQAAFRAGVAEGRKVQVKS